MLFTSRLKPPRDSSPLVDPCSSRQETACQETRAGSSLVQTWARAGSARSTPGLVGLAPGSARVWLVSDWLVHNTSEKREGKVISAFQWTEWVILSIWLMANRAASAWEYTRSVLFTIYLTDPFPFLEFVTGRGGAGFHSAGPALTTGWGGYFGGDPCPAPIRGESPLIPWTGPRFSPPVLTGTRLGNGRGRGQGQRTLKKHAPPRAVQRGGAGNWAGGPHFSGPRRPRNEHYPFFPFPSFPLYPCVYAKYESMSFCSNISSVLSCPPANLWSPSLRSVPPL